VKDTDEIMMISNRGTLVRTAVEEVRVMGRNTQGVLLIRLGEDEKLVEIEQIERLDDEDVDEEPAE
jgi:DNA gyrase subunit A